MSPNDASERPPELLYLELLKSALTRVAFPEPYEPPKRSKRLHRRALNAAARGVARLAGLEAVRRTRFDAERRAVGGDWPASAETMIGLRRLENLQACVTDVVQQGVPGDLIECGVWRGGASIFMKGVLAAYGDRERRVFLADSFQGLPPPDAERYPADAGDAHWTYEQLAVSPQIVRGNFERYELLDDRVHFLEGWFKDTLPDAPIDRLAILRVDGDMYESTLDALSPLYPKLSVGGYAIIDDYGAIPACKAAVEDFRSEHGITEPLVPIDWTGVYWKRER